MMKTGKPNRMRPVAVRLSPRPKFKRVQPARSARNTRRRADK